jgi:hypothetical protein
MRQETLPRNENNYKTQLQLNVNFGAFFNDARSK